MTYRGYPIEADGKRFTVWINDMPAYDVPTENDAKIIVDKLVKKEQKKRVRFSF